MTQIFGHIQKILLLFFLMISILGGAGCGGTANPPPADPVWLPSAQDSPAPLKNNLQIYRKGENTPLTALRELHPGEVVFLEAKGDLGSEGAKWYSTDPTLAVFVAAGELHVLRPGSGLALVKSGDALAILSLEIQPGEEEPSPLDEMQSSVSEREWCAATRQDFSGEGSCLHKKKIPLLPKEEPLPDSEMEQPELPPVVSEDPPEIPKDPTPDPKAEPDPNLKPPSIASDFFIDEVISFKPGIGAGFGSDRLPGIVLGPPQGAGPLQGGFDVLSLGLGGEVVLKSSTPILNGPGADFIVFENAFYIGGNPSSPFAEPGEVSVSQDGINFTPFPCDAQNQVALYPGCAGVHPVSANGKTNKINPVNPAEAGGDAFDLETIKLDWAFFIRIRDKSSFGGGSSAGFDLDAISIIHQ